MRNPTTITVTEFPVENKRGIVSHNRDSLDSEFAKVEGGYIELKNNGKVSVHRVTDSGGRSPLNNMSNISVYELVYRVLGGPNNEVKHTTAYTKMADYITDNAERFAKHEYIEVRRQDRAHLDVGEEVHEFVRYPVIDFLEENKLDFPEYDTGMDSFVDFIGEDIAVNIPLDMAIEEGFNDMIEDELKPTLLRNHFEDVVNISQDPHVFWEGWTRHVNEEASRMLDNKDLMVEFTDYLSRRADPLEFNRYHVMPNGTGYVVADLGNLRATKEFGSEEEAITRAEQLAESKGTRLIRNTKNQNGEYEGYILMDFE